MSATERTERDPLGLGAPTNSPDDRVRALPGGVAAVAVGVLLWVVSGNAGLIGGAVLLVAWAVLPATYAFAVGQVAFVAVTRPDGLLGVGLLPLALVEAGLAGVLVGPAIRSTRGRRTASWTLFGTAVLGGIALGGYALWDRVWVAAAVLVGLGALVAYGLHRYELVVLGKVPDPDDWSVGPEDQGTAAEAESENVEAEAENVETGDQSVEAGDGPDPEDGVSEST